MTRQEQILALVRQMLGSDADGTSQTRPRSFFPTPQDAEFIAAVIDRLPPQRLGGADRARVKLDYLLRALDADPQPRHQPPGDDPP
jgi:hypothetical protein